MGSSAYDALATNLLKGTFLWVPVIKVIDLVDRHRFATEDRTANEMIDPTSGASSETSRETGLRRSLSEVLGEELAASLARAKRTEGPTDAELDALFGTTSGAPGSSLGSAAASSSSPHADLAAASIEGRTTASDDPIANLKHAKYGYAALGGIVPPTDVSASATSASIALDGGAGGLLAGFSVTPQPKIHPHRTFLPGQMYDPSVS